MKTQLETELLYVQSVVNLTAQIKDLNSQIEIVNAGVMPAVWGSVGLTAPSGRDGSAFVRLTLEAMFEAALWGVCTLVTGPAAFGAAVVTSLIGSAISYLEGSQNAPGQSNTLTIQYAQLTDTMSSLYQSTNSIADRSQTAIVSDWGMLSAVGDAIASGAWMWPDGRRTRWPPARPRRSVEIPLATGVDRKRHTGALFSRRGLAVSIGFSYSCPAKAPSSLAGAVFYGGGVACRHPYPPDSIPPARSCRRKPHAARRGESHWSASLAASTG